jgi:hypothetical protein
MADPGGSPIPHARTDGTIAKAHVTLLEATAACCTRAVAMLREKRTKAKYDEVAVIIEAAGNALAAAELLASTEECVFGDAPIYKVQLDEPT